MNPDRSRRRLLRTLRDGGSPIVADGETLEERAARAVRMVEDALLGTEPLRRVWTDSDYLVAALAILTGDGQRARDAALAEYARRPVE